MQKEVQKKFLARIGAVEVLAQGVRRISIIPNDEFEYGPQQYIWLEIPEMKLEDKRGSRRAFTITNLKSDKNILQIIARISESGYKQSLFALKKGDEVVIHGPFGESFSTKAEELQKNRIFITGGTGVSAFLPVLDCYLSSSQSVGLCRLIAFHRSPEVSFLEVELNNRKRRAKFFDYKLLFSTFSLEAVRDFQDECGANIDWYIYGAQDFVDLVYEKLEQSGVSILQMHFGEVYPQQKNSLTLEVVQAQLKENNLFANVIQSSTNHAVITDTTGRVLFANLAAEKITGYSHSEIIGNTPRLWGGMMSPEFYKNLWEKKKKGGAFVMEITNRRKNGDLYYAIAHIAPIFDEKKEIIGYIGSEEDITEMKQKEARIKENENRLKFALEGGQSGLWDWTIASGNVFYSARSLEMFGYSQEEFSNTITAWRERVHSEDRASVEAAMDALVHGDTGHFEVRHRMLCKNGEYKWIMARGMVTERLEDGTSSRATGTHTDITEITVREKELERINALMVDRELKMIELKKRIAILESQA